MLLTGRVEGVVAEVSDSVAWVTSAEGDADTADSGDAGVEVTTGVEVTGGVGVTGGVRVDVWAGGATVVGVVEGTESETETGFFSNMVDRI